MTDMDIDSPLPELSPSSSSHHHPPLRISTTNSPSLPLSHSHSQSTLAESGTRPPSSTFVNQSLPLRSALSAMELETNPPHTARTSDPGPSSGRLPFYTLATRPGPPDLRLRLHAKQDLVNRLGLLPAFDELVRPYIRVPDWTTAPSDEKGKGKAPESPVVAANGKGKAKELNPSLEGKKLEHEKGWRHLTTQVVGGKFSSKKDTFLGDLLSIPPRFGRLEIRRFDYATLNGFRLEEGQLDPEVLKGMDEETRRGLGLGPDEKKKKKKKKPAEGVPQPDAASPTSATLPTSASTPYHPAPNGHAASPRLNGVPTPSPRPVSKSPYPTNTTHRPQAQSTPQPSKIRKDRGDEGTPNPNNTNRPHKKRKTDGPSTPRDPHHGMQPMQQATPTVSSF